MENKDTNRNRKMKKTRMHLSDSSSGVLQPTTVTNTTHPRLSTTSGRSFIKTGFHRMWAQLQKEQGSPLDKQTLEAKYKALHPNEHQEWESIVQESTGTSRNKELQKEIIAAVVELGRMPRESRCSSREANLKQKIRKHNLFAWAKRELQSRSIPYVRTRLTRKTSASSPAAQLKSLCMIGRCDAHPATELSSEMKAMDDRAPSRGRKRKAIDAGLISHPAQESEEVDRTITEDASIDLGWTWYLPEEEQAIWKFVQDYGRPLETKKKNKQEKRLARHIRCNWLTLDTVTKELIQGLDDPAGVTALAQADLDRLIKKDPNATHHELIRGLKAIVGRPSVSALMSLKYNEDGTPSDIWRRAGIHRQIKPLSQGKIRLVRIPLAVLHHNYYHACHQEIETIFSDDPHPAEPKKRTYADFYAACRAPDKRHLEPFSTNFATQCGSRRFRPYQCIEQLALIELVDMSVEKLPYTYNKIQNLIRVARNEETNECQVLSHVLDSAVQRLCSYCNDPTWADEHARFVGVQGTATERQGKLRSMVQTLADAFEKQNIDARAFKPNHFATLSVYYALFVGKDDTCPRNGLNRWCCGLRSYIPGAVIEATDEKQKHLASSCMPRHYESSDNAEPPGLGKPGRAVAAAPVTCELCHQGLSGFDKLKFHCAKKHGNLAEYRKRVFWRAKQVGLVELHPWVKRNMVQNFQFFRLHSVPSSINEWTHKATLNAQPRREEACAVCAVKDWLENRYQVFLFAEATGTTTWAKFFFATGEYYNEHANLEDDNEHAGEAPLATTGMHHNGHALHRNCGVLLVDENGTFCAGPRDKVNDILAVGRYVSTWPLIPTEELHASSVQHPDDLNMRWLLHTRRVQCEPVSDVAQHIDKALPRSAGVGVKDATVWMCKSCVENLCLEQPKMPPLALANACFGGRHHPLFREASLATRTLASSARLVMKQLLLGRGPDDEVHKGMTGNPMLIAQPSATYDQVLPNLPALNDRMVVIFCRTIDDVSKAPMLFVDREPYREMVKHRKEVCPTFADIIIDDAAIDKLPNNAVPETLMQGAQAMPEAAGIHTTMQGPTNRIPLTHRHEQDDSESDSSDDAKKDGGVDSQHTASQRDSLRPDGDDAHHANSERDHLESPEQLNENETIIGVNDESCPRPLRLFEAWREGMTRINTEAAKFAQAEAQRHNSDEPLASRQVAVVKQIAAKEMVRTSIAVDMIDVARRMTKSIPTRAEMQSLMTAQTEHEQQMPLEALAVPSGKPLSMFDPCALPAAYTEFLFGDLVPFLKRETKVTAQQIFAALPSREELQYQLDGDLEPYIAANKSRWDTAEFFAVAASFLRNLRMLQSVKASMDRPGFEKDFRSIAATTSRDFTEAVLHPSAPRSNQDLMHNAGNERVRNALRHLGFSTATVPLTDGNKMRLHHHGCGMNQIFGPLTVFHTHNYADNYSPEILKLLCVEQSDTDYVENIDMPTLQQMHIHTASSPRATYKLFTLFEELSYRHLYKVDQAWLGNFRLTSVNSFTDSEDDFASNGLRGLADFTTAIFKCIEAQARGFAHGHGKVHSIPDGVTGLKQCLEKVTAQITKLGLHPTEELVERMVTKYTETYNQGVIASASTRQYESSTLTAKQLGLQLPDAPFSETQQRQSRYDGGTEDDDPKTKRPFVAVRQAELPAHITRDRRRLQFEHQPCRNEYKELPLTGSQLCTAAHYLLPHSFCQEPQLGEEGECEESNVLQLAGLPWVFDEVTGELLHFIAEINGRQADALDFHKDAVVFEKCFGRDVRFLHSHNHDHNCSGTCVKNVKNKSKMEVTKLLKPNRAPPCRFEFYHIVNLEIQSKPTKIRRRGKEIVLNPSISSTTTRNQLGSVALERPHPFRSPSTDCGLVALRSNNDFRYMPKGFPDTKELEQAFRCDVSQLTACFRSLTTQIRAHKAVRHMAMTVVALHVAAKIIDFYITKYSAKPMEQLQNLVTQYALGLQRLELEEDNSEQAKQTTPAPAGDGAHLATTQTEPAPASHGAHLASAAARETKAYARRVLLRLQTSANRAKWISATECALYVHTEQQHWTSHNEVPMFTGRPLYQLWECKRILSCSKNRPTRADTSIQFSVVNYSCSDETKADDAIHSTSKSTSYTKTEHGDSSALLPIVNVFNVPTSLWNVGDTCFMNALMQCYRQMLLRIPADMRPKTDGCPLAAALTQQSFSEEDIRQWPFWEFLEKDQQQDACEILEMCFNDEHSMHGSCKQGDCFATLFRKLTSFELTRETLCENPGCLYSKKERTTQYILIAEPSGNAESSIKKSLAVSHIDSECQECHSKHRKQQQLIDKIPQFMIVHINKYSNHVGPATHQHVCVAGTVMQRVAVIHHAGHTPNSGHYTCTVATPEGMAYRCNDASISQQPNLMAQPWQNSYLIFLQRDSSGDIHHIAESIAESTESVRSDSQLTDSDVEVLSECREVSDDDADDTASDGDEYKDEKVDSTSDDSHHADTEFTSASEDEDDNVACSDPHHVETEPTMQAAECRVTATRHDDWLHRGPFLADMPWHIYMMRVQRDRKPRLANADYSEYFFFDKHYSLSVLYCQKVGYTRTATIPRLVGAVCPPEEEEDGEPHAAHKLTLFSRARCLGPEHCADPLNFRSLLFPSDKPDNDQMKREKARFAPCWKACRCEMAMKARQAKEKETLAEKIAVMADTTLMKDFKRNGGGAHPTDERARRLRPLLLQMCTVTFIRHAEQMPEGIVELVDCISGFLCPQSLYHTEQLHLGQFVALEAHRINENIDMDILVRKKPFREDKQGGFINDVDSDDEKVQQANAIRSEFLGGAGEDDEVFEDETEDMTNRRQALVPLNTDECKAMLRRDQEIQRTEAPGRHKEADVQMKGYVGTFGKVLEMNMHQVPIEQRSHLRASLPFLTAMDYQRAVAKEMRMQQQSEDIRQNDTTVIDIESLLQLQLRNQDKEDIECVSVPLADAMKGPRHVALKLMREAENDSEKPVHFNEEQSTIIATCIYPLEQAWQQHIAKQHSADATLESLHFLPNDLGLPRVLIIGGGGCGKTTMMQIVLVPVLKTFFRKVVLTAPSNRAARGFDPTAKTLHSVSGMKPQDSMRTSSLHIKTDQMRKRLDANQTHAGAWIHDEALQTGASLWNAAALRTTYARETHYRLDPTRYAKANETMGRISFLLLCGDHLQLPPVPKSSGFLAPMENASDEHKAGASMFNNIHYVFEMETMMRFKDHVLVAILQKMRKPGGDKLTEEEWKALLHTEIDVLQLEKDPEAFLRDTHGWFETCYLWSVVSMACYTRAIASARHHKQTLFFSQAVDYSEQAGNLNAQTIETYKQMLAVPSAATTSRLPGIVLLHIGMRVRITTQVLPPWAVQDATGTIMEIEASAVDRRNVSSSGTHPASEMRLTELPLGVYVKLDNCDREFLPPLVCSKHQVCGFTRGCADCRAFEGWVLIEPITRTWTFTDPRSNGVLKVARRQLPLMPAEACPLYSLQGATCDPGLIAHLAMPKRADEDIKWLIVYVMLSRVRSLANLKCVGLNTKIRKIIEGGPPAMLAENFENKFRAKITNTQEAAAAAKAYLKWQ